RGARCTDPKATACRCRTAGAEGDGSAAPRPKIAAVERREASVPRHGTQGASQAPGTPPMREGQSQGAGVEAANFAALGYRDRVTIRWPNCPFWEPLEFFMRNDGTIIRTDIAPTQPDIEAQFFALAASPWLPTAVNADAKT